MLKRYERRRTAGALFMAYMKYLAWIVLTKIPLGFIYINIIAEGLRMLVPPLGQKLHRIPGLAALAQYEETHKLDLAPLFAMFLLVGVFYLWSRLIQLWIEADRGAYVDWLGDRETTLVLLLGAVILLADAILFYVAMAEFSWGSMFSLTALIATAAYVAVLIFVSYVSVNLHNDIIYIKEG